MVARMLKSPLYWSPIRSRRPSLQPRQLELVVDRDDPMPQWRGICYMRECENWSVVEHLKPEAETDPA
jgi:hypothetical protein